MACKSFKAYLWPMKPRTEYSYNLSCLWLLNNDEKLLGL